MKVVRRDNDLGKLAIYDFISLYNSDEVIFSYACTKDLLIIILNLIKNNFSELKYVVESHTDDMSRHNDNKHYVIGHNDKTNLSLYFGWIDDGTQRTSEHNHVTTYKGEYFLNLLIPVKTETEDYTTRLTINWKVNNFIAKEFNISLEKIGETGYYIQQFIPFEEDEINYYKIVVDE